MWIDRPGPEALPQLRRLWQLAFGDTEEFLDLFFSTAYSPDRCRCITEANRITAALYWFDCSCNGQKLAYLYAVATHPDHRGNGLCRALMADTHALLAAQGYAGALLVPEGDSLRQMYRRLGYRDCTTLSEFSCAAGEISAPLVPVSGAEFARLRPGLTPEGSVFPVGETLAFLEKQAVFYTGPGLLLTAIREADRLFCPELLGDPAAAPGILKALHCTCGTFRTPGPGTSFAMYLPLTPGAPDPTYFVFAFD